MFHDGPVVCEPPVAAYAAARALEIVLDRPPDRAPPGFRPTPTGLETDLEGGTAEAALAVCRAHRLAVRASRVRLRSLEDAVLATCEAVPR